MDEKKKRLIELVELLKFPLPPEESKKHVESLTEEELDSLIETYQTILDYEVALNDLAMVANPEEYKKTKEKFNKQLLDMEIEYADRLEGIQKGEDEQLEELEKNSDEKIDAISSNSKKKFQEVENAADDLSLSFKPISPVK